MLGIGHLLAVAAVLAAGASGTWAQQGIYTCVDAKGRRLTSDRPIADCLDREQKQLNASGTVRKTIGPSLTASERAALEEQARKANDEKLRQAEEKRRERAMLNRYPNQALHDAERVKALNAVQEVIASAVQRTQDLREQRKALEAESEFYKDTTKMPPKLRRALDENDSMVAGQARFLANQEEEKRRVNAQFDQELARLKVLWAQVRGTPEAAAAPQPPVPTAQ